MTFFEVASAMQKEIRGGNEEAAMYWGIELSGRYPDFTWYRLATIASEDIGSADNSIAILVDVLRRNYVEAAKKTKRPGERIILAHAIIALCRAPKSRIADDPCALISHPIESENQRLEVPDFALDSHTQRGRKKGRQIDAAGWDHWTEEGLQTLQRGPGIEHLQGPGARAAKETRTVETEAGPGSPRCQEARARSIQRARGNQMNRTIQLQLPFGGTHGKKVLGTADRATELVRVLADCNADVGPLAWS